MNHKDIIEFAKKGVFRSAELAERFDVSRQYVNRLISELLIERKLVKAGSTRSAKYMLPDFAKEHLDVFPDTATRRYENEGLQEHVILDEIEGSLPKILTLPENVRSIFTFGFSEMVNNAIEHSESSSIKIEAGVQGDRLTARIEDSGIGAFRNIRQKKHLESELEAIQDLLKGKTTTMPISHSGEGIFFTSRAVDRFVLESYGYRLTVDNAIPDVFVEQLTTRSHQGTRVVFELKVDTKRSLTNVFKKYSNIGDDSDYGFDKTEVLIKLYTVGGSHISRSEARRVLHGLNRFKVVVFDFDNVPMVGQAFADEVFRVFRAKNPDIRLEVVNANEGVRFMIDRVEGNNPRSLDLFQ